MSRSYKKHPICTDHHVKTSKEMKRIANKKIRSLKNELFKGGDYKKAFCSYDICDYKFRKTWAEAKWEFDNEDYRAWWLKKQQPTLKSWWREWFKYYRMK